MDPNAQHTGTEKPAADPGTGTTGITKIDGTNAYFVNELYSAKTTRDVDFVMTEASEYKHLAWFPHIQFLAAARKWSLEGGTAKRAGI